MGFHNFFYNLFQNIINRINIITNYISKSIQSIEKELKIEFNRLVKEKLRTFNKV